MDNQKSIEILTSLLNAYSTEEVDEIINSCHFQDIDWAHYGGREKNWDTVSAQQTDGVSALTELITNSIDAVLMRKAFEQGITNLFGDDSPQSMQEAVREFYGVNEGRLSSLSNHQRSKLAKESILIGVKRAKKSKKTPTITIVDFGEGQRPEKFEETFLSLGESNKEGIGFVQGKFNMGSTGSLSFCTKSDIRNGHYKLIASRRYDSDCWGWTLIKVFQVELGKKLPIVKFLKPGGSISSFRHDELIRAFGHREYGAISQGTIVRLYDYDVGGIAHRVSTGLRRSLALNLIDCALPVQIYDFDAERDESRSKPRKEGIFDITFSGLNTFFFDHIEDHSSQDPEIKTVKPDQPTTEFIHLVCDINDNNLGRVRIIAIGVSDLPFPLQNTKKRVYYTINGQTHNDHNASFLNTKDVGLGNLQQNLIVNIECEGMDKTALSTIFSGNRERAKDIQLFRELERKVKFFLKQDSKLRQYDQVIRFRRASALIEEDPETKKMLSDLVASDPQIMELLGAGDVVTAPIQRPGGEERWLGGKQFPTYLKPVNVGKNNDEQYIKELPVNSYRKVRCETDAANDYLTRTNSRGEWRVKPDTSIDVSAKLYNGIATFTFSTSPDADFKIGDEKLLNVGFYDYGPRGTPLTFSILIKFTEEEKQKNNPGGERSDTRKINKRSFKDPIKWVVEKDWNSFQFDHASGATVVVDDSEVITVYVNKDHDVLRRMRNKENDDARRMLNENRFRVCLGLLTLAMYKSVSSEEDACESVEKYSSAIAPYVLSLVVTLGEGKRL